MVTIGDDIREKALQTVRTLTRLGGVRAVYLFGSHVEGRANAWSDIDLAAFMTGIEDWDIEQRAKAMSLVMQEVGANVEAHLFPASVLEKPEKGSFAQDILKRGICVYEG